MAAGGWSRIGSLRVLVLLHRRFVDRHGRLCHHLHRVAGRQERQLLEPQAAYDISDCLFELSLGAF